MADALTYKNVNIYKLELVSHTGETINLIELFLTLNLYESIFTYNITGKLILIDTIDIIKNMPIIGGETINVSFGIDEDNIKNLKFDIYKIQRDEAGIRDEKKKIVILYVSSKGMLANERKRFSKRFNTSIDSILTEVTTHFESSKLVESTQSENINYLSNYWTAYENIAYILTNAIRPDYFFYETMESFKFTTFEDMLSDEYGEIIFDIYDESKQASTDNILSYKIDNYFDLPLSYKSKIFGNTNYCLDDINYNIEKTVNTYSDIMDNFANMGKNRLFVDELYSVENDINTHDSDIINHRSPFIKGLSNNNLVIKLHGTISRYAGQSVVMKNYPTIDNKSNYHELFSGKWLITDINHSIDNDGKYEQNLALVKTNYFAIQDNITERV
ncbi:hypothetical protein [uncultured Arcobacter sp.]|uniref:hypothetical protein n=1 Tax=uncultured Arcobacter sp. TaxID=165434 RepID=UPI00261DC0DD|nr:hypothetical protein [uncultured Arcobacter sp.]